MSGTQEYPYGEGYTLGPYPDNHYTPGGRVARKTCLAMFVAQGASGLAQDKICNNFTFRHNTEDGALEAADYTEVRAAVSAFYEQSGAQGTLVAQNHPIGAYLSPWVSRTAELRLYDGNQAKPRVPITSSITLGAALDTHGYPEEVSICLSFRTDTPNTARRRGRIFLGPLATYAGAIVAGDVAGPARVGVSIMQDLLRAANRLSAMSSAMRWVTLSKFDSDTTVHPVKFAWVDDAIDTQRRRGADAGTRQTYDLDQPA